jgi:hemoglobin
MLGLHAGIGEVDDDLGDRFVACFLQAIDDAGFPDDAELRTVLRDYMGWAVGEVMSYAPEGSVVEPDLRTPRWGWTGRE